MVAVSFEGHSCFGYEFMICVGKVNAVDDGIPFVAFLGIFTYFVGQKWWTNTLFGDFTYASGLIVFVWVAGVGTHIIKQHKY